MSSLPLWFPKCPFLTQYALEFFNQYNNNYTQTFVVYIHRRYLIYFNFYYSF